MVKVSGHVRRSGSDVSKSDAIEEIAVTLARSLTPEKYDELKSILDSRGPLAEEISRWVAQESRPKTKPKINNGHVTVMSPSHYQALREAIARNSFQRQEGSPWPTASLKKGGQVGQAQLIPPCLDGQSLSPEEIQTWSEMMWKQREQLSDLDVDVLDILSAIWLENAKSAEDDAIVDLDSLLELRGLSQRVNCNGYSSGYRAEQRAEIFRSVVHIQNLWLNMAQINVKVNGGRAGRPRKKLQTLQSRAFVITDRMGQLRLDGCIDVEKFLFRPGKVFGQFLFGPGRETALLSAKALHYDPYRQTWEKRLTRYFSWHWKHTTHSESKTYPYPVKSLLEAAGQEIQARFPQRTRARLESALANLLNDKVISHWEYQNWTESSQKNWVDAWSETTLLVVPPGVFKKQLRQPSEQYAETDSFGQRLRAVRLKHKLSQAQASKNFGITQAYLSKLENGKSPILEANPTLQELFRQWVEEGEL